MSGQSGDNSDLDHDESASLTDMRNLMRTTFHWVVIDGQGEQSAPGVLDLTNSESNSNTISDSDCVIIASPKKRKLEDDTSALSTGDEVPKPQEKRACHSTIVDTKSDAFEDNDVEIVEAHSCWHKLPQPLVVKIMSYLNDKSRLNMALSCKEWSKLIRSACLWRNLVLELSAFKSVDKPLIQYTKTHAKHINRVIITWRRPSYIISTKIHNGLNKILGHLTSHSQVTIFRMHYMELDRYWRFESRREKLLNTISKFLESQRKIKIFVMNSAQAGLNQGCKMLESIARMSSGSVHTLNIEDFFQSRISPFRVQRYLDALSHFTNIRHLYLNYNCLSDEVMEHLASVCKLQNFSIKVYKNDPHSHRISQTCWSMLKRTCPKLEVNFEFDQVPCYTDIAPIITAQVPLTSLYIWSGYEEEEEWRICDTLYHIVSHFSTSIESFTLEIENDAEVIDDALLRMVECCKRLYHLDVNAVINTTTVEQICRLQEEAKISLQSLYITIAGVPNSNTQQTLDEILFKYADIVEAYNLDFQFTADVISVSEVNYVPIDMVQQQL